MESPTSTQPVVVGVDDNPPAQVALRWAVQEARLHDLPLRLVAVDPGSSVAESLDAATRYASERLPEGRVDARLVAGQPAEELLSESMDAGLLVVGSRSLSTIASMALGSVSSAVAAHASCPVVVVRASKSTALHNIVVGVDGSDSSERALAFAFSEAALRGLSVCVSHVWRPNRQADPDIWTTERENVEREHRRSWLRQYVAPYAARHPGVPVTVLVSDGRAATVLAHQSRTADLIVVGSRGHGGLARLLLGSVSQGVLHHARCSVAIIRGEVTPEPQSPSSGEEICQR